MRDRTTVITEIKQAVSRERQAALQVLILLREIDADEHYLEMGFPSLFEFATQELGYSTGAAHRRIQSMRLLGNHPEIAPRIESGELSLCVAAKTQSFFRKENQRLREAGAAHLSMDVQSQVIQSMLGSSARECEQKLILISPQATIPTDKTRQIGNDQILIQFVADRALMTKLDKLKFLTSHRNFEGDYKALFHELADIALKKIDPAAKSASVKDVADADAAAADAPKINSNVGKNQARQPAIRMASRYIPAPTRRLIWVRDRGRCTYIDTVTGRSCKSRHALEYDHILPYAHGGDSRAENLRLRCRAHNQFTARQQGLNRPVN